jgi:hypothetical protein
VAWYRKFAYLMNSDALPTLAPKVFRFNDFDQYRTAVRKLAVEFTPLVRKISAAQTILHLPGCDINFAQSFPRIAEGQLAPNCTAVGFSMDDGSPIRFNGVERDRSAIVIGHNGATYTTVERTERQFTSVIFTQEMQDRGWPQAGPNWKMFETSESAHHRLRELVKQILSSSSGFDASEVSDVPLRCVSPWLPPSMPHSPTLLIQSGPLVRTPSDILKFFGTSRQYCPVASGVRSTAESLRDMSASRYEPCTTRFSDARA